ncbi:MAG: hypothetical protein WDO15_02320 [Bacteroidota bacterium]
MHPLPFMNEGFVTDLKNFTLLAYTDGVTETMNEAGQEFGLNSLQDYFRKEQG